MWPDCIRGGSIDSCMMLHFQSGAVKLSELDTRLKDIHIPLSPLAVSIYIIFTGSHLVYVHYKTFVVSSVRSL